jgi:hypothetical protein
MITTIKGQLTNQYYKILKLKFVSLLHFINFEHCPEKFPVTAYESLWMAFWFSSSEN